MSFPTNGWRERVATAANDDEQFGVAAEQFDGSVTFEVGDEVAWFKIYRGSVIDTEPYVPPFGTTFRITGEQSAWTELLEDGRSFSEQIYAGRLRTAGNKLEANRMREATELLVRCLRRQEGRA